MPLPLTSRFDIPNAHTLPVARTHGAYASLERLFAVQPAQVIELVKASGLRGRGGAGFPAGLKWSFVPQDTGKPVYLCVNADESEPGTYKDRHLLEKDPHQLLEGIIIASYAIGCHHAYIYIRGEFDLSRKRLEQAIAEAYQAGYLGKTVAGKGYTLDVTIHRGAGAYICGEETALLESIEGKPGKPRTKPPFPATHGLFGCPTVVNNVETLATLPYIIMHGAEGYRKFGTEKSPGTKLFSSSGHIRKPGVYEISMGYPLLDFIEKECGGVVGTLKAVIPGGSSVPILRADEIGQVMLDYESIAEAGSMLGSGGLIVMNDSVNMVWALENLAHFYSHESCGQCTPCREGTHWAHELLKRGLAGDGKRADIDLLLNISKNMVGKTICVLADALAMPIDSYIAKFRDEFEACFST
jgi:NADH-quinone oxidoreductase subunit F